DLSRPRRPAARRLGDSNHSASDQAHRGRTRRAECSDVSTGVKGRRQRAEGRSPRGKRAWTARTSALCLLTSAFICEVLMATELPKTAAETSNYLSTSRYADVMAFVGAIQRADADIRVETFATTNEGRALPLVIVGPYTPQSARASGKPVVFIMANIHAGEVEGKEAAQMLLRDLVSTHRKLRDDVIVLVAPIYNADGNERISP